MEREIQQRVWAAGAYADLTPPKLAKELGVSVDTLKRRVRGEQGMRALESEEGLLRRIAEVTGLPYEFFTADFARLGEIAPLPAGAVFEEAGDVSRAEELLRLQESVERNLAELREVVERTLEQARAGDSAELVDATRRTKQSLAGREGESVQGTGAAASTRDEADASSEAARAPGAAKRGSGARTGR